MHCDSRVLRNRVVAGRAGRGCADPAAGHRSRQYKVAKDVLPGQCSCTACTDIIARLWLQACLLLYKLWGGNISSRTPGDPANMFSYTGPTGIRGAGKGVGGGGWPSALTAVLVTTASSGSISMGTSVTAVHVGVECLAAL